MSGPGMQLGLQRFNSKQKITINEIDYSGIIASLNNLTNSSDTVYNGVNPTLSAMEIQLDSINGEIITS